MKRGPASSATNEEDDERSSFPLDNNNSIDYIRQRKTKEQLLKLELDLQIFHETRQLKQKLINAIDEANRFCFRLNLDISYSSELKNNDAEIEQFDPVATLKGQDVIPQQKYLHSSGNPQATKIQKHSVTGTTEITLKRFWKEHSELWNEFQSITAIERPSTAPDGSISEAKSREEIESQVNAVLQDMVEQNKLLESQLQEIRDRGWNLY